MSAESIAASVRQLIEKLENIAKTGDTQAAAELQRIRFALHQDYLIEIWRRASEGLPLENNWPAMDILELAFESVQRLLRLAEQEHPPVELRSFVQKRGPILPALIGMPALEKRFRAAWKNLGGGESAPYKLRRKTKPDAFFRVAVAAIRYLTGPCDSFSALYYAPFIKGLARIKHPRHAIEKYRERKLGLFTRANWLKWKPLFQQYLTLNYAPTWDRWKCIPPNWQDNLYLALHFGCFNEWFARYAKIKRLTPKTAAALRQDFTAQTDVEESLNIRPLAKSTPGVWEDPTLQKLTIRAQNRDSDWFDFKQALLTRIERLAPPR